MAKTVQELQAHFVTMFTADLAAGQQAAMELNIILAAIAALPDVPGEHYEVYDPEDGTELPAGIYGLPSQSIASWDGAHPLSWGHGQTSWGYGDVARTETRAGPGLIISMGGSPLQSAGSVWILPVAYEGSVA